MPTTIKKINPDITPVETEPYIEPKKSSLPKRIGIIFLVLLVVFLVGGGLCYFSFQGVISRVKDVIPAARATSEAIKNQDLDNTKAGLAEIRRKIVVLRQEYSKVLVYRWVPLLGSYIIDGEHGLNAAFAALDAGDKAIEALEPNADLLGLKGKSKFVQGTADDRIQLAVKTMSALVPKINEMAKSVDTLRKEIDAIDPNRYPARIGKTEIRSKLVGAKEVIENAANLFVNAQPLLINLPKMLGEPVDKRYLVLFQNDKELRATGGFITAYAQFRMVKGKAILERADDIYTMDAGRSKKFAAPPEILKFHKGVTELFIRDSNLSPDFKVSMQSFETLYNTVAGREKIDGIMAVDTHVLVEALRILGPMTVYNREFSAETDKRCDCPKAVYELEDYSTRPVGYLRDARKDIIGVLLHQILQKSLGVSPSQYWGKLFQMLLTEIGQKHVLAYFHDADTQKAAESFNMGGRIMTASDSATLLKFAEGKGWDYLHVNNSNMGGAKANMFVTSKVTKDVSVNGDGTVTTKLAIEYKNSYPGSDCGLESGGLCLNAPLRNWVRVYVPQGSTLVESKGTIGAKDGKSSPMDTYDSLGKTVFEGFLIVNPMGTARLDLTYTSPVTSPDSKYYLLIQKQPGTDNIEYLIKLGGKDKKKFELLSDTEIVL